MSAKAKEGLKIISDVKVTTKAGSLSNMIGKTDKSSQAKRIEPKGVHGTGKGDVKIIPLNRLADRTDRVSKTAPPAGKRIGLKERTGKPREPVVKLENIGEVHGAPEGETSGGESEAESVESTGTSRTRRQVSGKGGEDTNKEGLCKVKGNVNNQGDISEDTTGGETTEDEDEVSSEDSLMNKTVKDVPRYEPSSEVHAITDALSMGRDFRKSVTNLKLLFEEYAKKRGGISRTRMTFAIEEVLDKGNRLVDSNNFLSGELKATRAAKEEITGQLGDKVENVARRMEEVRDTPVTVQGGGGNSSRSYAQMVSGKEMIQRKVEIAAKEKHELTIRNAEGEGINKETKAEIMKKLGAERRINIRNAVLFRNGSIRIETQRKEDVERIRDSLAGEGKFRIETPRKMKPRIMIYDTPREMAEGDILEALTCQNGDIGIQGDKKKDIRFVFMTGNRTSDLVNRVLEVSPEIRNVLVGINRVHLGYQYCRVVDFVATSRCYKCQGYGHIAKDCKSVKDICGKCGTEGHKKTDCASKEVDICATCKVKGMVNYRHMNKECPLYKIALDRMIRNTDYVH